MEAVIFGALLGSTLPRILDAMEASWNQPKGLKHAVLSIQDELKYIQIRIAKYRESAETISIFRNFWIAQLRRLEDDIQDCMDLYLYERRKMPVRKFQKQIDDLNRRVKDAHEKLQLYEPGAGVSSSSTTTGGRQAAVEGRPDANGLAPVGMEEPLNDLRELVLRAPSFNVISIVGFGGLGKTYLANQLYNDEVVGDTFPVRAWALAADRDADEVVKEINKQLLEGGATTSAHIASQVKEKVKNGAIASNHNMLPISSPTNNNRHLIVIDKVSVTRQWDAMQSALLGADGVAADRTTTIVMTTSIMSVARHCSSGAGHVYSMQTLDDANSRKLFFTTLATSGSSAPPSHAVEQESSAILKKCDGLPLALVSTAQFLKENRMAAGVHGCEEISRRLHALPKDGTVLERMHQVLVQSYGSLPSIPIRDCLLYFCMFPPEHGVETGPLVRRLLAEGIVQNPHEAVENLRILMDHSIIQSSQVSNNDGAAKRYRTHGMMLEYVSRESMSEKFTTLLRPAETVREPDSVRRLSVHHDRISGAANYVGLMLPEEDLSRLHTLSVFPTSATTNYLQQGSLLHAADQADHLKLCRYELLRVLDLKHCPHLRKKHLEAICDALFLLKYLSFGGSLHRVPRNIKKLKRLETLDLSRSEIVTVYKEAILLPKLKHLLGKFQLSKSDTKLRGTGYLERLLQEKSDLETLSGFVTGERKGFPQLMSHMASRRLSKVKIWCKPNADAENLHHLKEGIKAFVSQDNHRPKVDYSLSIDSHECQIPFLESLEAPGSLSSLKLHGRLNKIPPFVALAQLAAVRELSLSGTGLSGAVVLAGLSGLTRLKYLKLCEAKMGPLTIGAHQVPSLERICLVGENTMTGIKFEDGALQYLVSLHLLCQALIDVLPDYQIGGLPNLTEVVLHSGLAQAIKDAWKEDARRHPNRPSISFTGGP